MKKKIGIIVAALLALALIVWLIIFLAVIRPNQIKQQEHEAAVARYREEKTRLYLQENEKYADYQVDVAFLGDSLTDGYDLQRHYPQ